MSIFDAKPNQIKAAKVTKVNKHAVILGSLIVGTIVFGTAALFIDTKTVKKESPTVKSAQTETQIQEQNQPMIDSVKKQTILPTDEQPVLATVADREKLQNQKFFEQAKNGDQVLMYPKNKKVFLYRPDIDKVVAEAPLDYQDTPSISVSE
jgi:hypothetical protein